MNKAAQSVWENCLNFIEDNIQPQAYKTWFEPIVAIKLDDHALSVQVPSKFFYEWLEEHYVKILKVALTKELGATAKLVYIIKMENTYGNKQPFTEKIPSSNRSAVYSQRVDIPLKSINPELKNPFVIPGIRNVKIESQLNPIYTFDNFLEGDSNRLARNASIAVANKPGGTSFNPLLIFGGVGLGKMTEAELNEIHNQMVASILATSGKIDKIYHCRDTDDSSLYRKPNTGMGLMAK